MILFIFHSFPLSLSLSLSLYNFKSWPLRDASSLRAKETRGLTADWGLIHDCWTVCVVATLSVTTSYATPLIFYLFHRAPLPRSLFRSKSADVCSSRARREKAPLRFLPHELFSFSFLLLLLPTPFIVFFIF